MLVRNAEMSGPGGHRPPTMYIMYFVSGLCGFVVDDLLTPDSNHIIAFNREVGGQCSNLCWD